MSDIERALLQQIDAGQRVALATVVSTRGSVPRHAGSKMIIEPASGTLIGTIGGGAKSWLGPHVSGNTHAQNIEQGLYPLEDPVARARLCLHCHMGTKDKPIDHRIMGAGHPPLEFELDTFTNIQPGHFRVDKDYRERKTYAPGAKVWAIGQLLAAETFLTGLLSERFADRGMFPELVFFDCNACHHAMQQPRWNAGVGADSVRITITASNKTGGLESSSAFSRTTRRPVRSASDLRYKHNSVAFPSSGLQIIRTFMISKKAMNLLS